MEVVVEFISEKGGHRGGCVGRLLQGWRPSAVIGVRAARVCVQWKNASDCTPGTWPLHYTHIEVTLILILILKLLILKVCKKIFQ